MKRTLALVLALVLPTTLGCAALRPVTASSDDLADYRKTRLAATVPEHLVASAAYLERHPRGAWADEVRASWETEELAYFERSQSSRERALEYLSWLPHGPHADAALAVVRAFDGHVADDETAHLVAAAKKTTAALDAQANERKALEDELLAAIAAIVRAPLGGPFSAAPDLVRVVRGARASTWGDGLERVEHDAFVLPSRDGPIARELERTIVADEREGVLVGAELRGLHLFATLLELASTRPSSDADAPAALAHVVDVAKGALPPAAAGCSDDASDRGWVRRCPGVVVYVRPGEPGVADSPDRVGIRRAP